MYLIKIARVGTRKEGQPDNDPNDFRLVFEIEFVKKLFKDYKPVELGRGTNTVLDNALS